MIFWAYFWYFQNNFSQGCHNWANFAISKYMATLKIKLDLIFLLCCHSKFEIVPTICNRISILYFCSLELWGGNSTLICTSCLFCLDNLLELKLIPFPCPAAAVTSVSRAPFLNRFFSLTEGNSFSLVNQFHQGHQSTKPNRTESSVQCANISLNWWVQFEVHNQFKPRFGAGRSHKPRTNRTEPKGALFRTRILVHDLIQLATLATYST